MRLIYVVCGPEAARVAIPSTAEVITASSIPTRAELRPLDAAAKEILPVDPTPSLDEIAAQPDVKHLGEPQRAPQQPEEALRVVVIGTDASLSAVLTRMMRGDYLWAEVGYVPLSGDSAAAKNWGLPASVEFAATAPVKPAPVIRNDAGLVVAGSASLTAWDGGSFEGEVIVDDDTILNQPDKIDNARFFSPFGVRMVPTVDAPGIVAARLVTPAEGNNGSWLGRMITRSMSPEQVQSWFETPSLSWMVKKAPVRAGGVDPASIMQGRAVQVGGNEVRVTVDGVSAKRPVARATFYRHLRDLQIVRP